MAERVPIEGPYCGFVGMRDLVGGVDGLSGGVGGVGGVVRGESEGLAGRGIRFVEEVVVQRAVDGGGGEEGDVDGVPGQRHDVAVVTFEEEHVAHHAEVKDARCRVLRAGRQELASVGLEGGLVDGIFVAVQRR